MNSPRLTVNSNEDHCEEDIIVREKYRDALRRLLFTFGLALAVVMDNLICAAFGEEPPVSSYSQPAWGRITQATNSTGMLLLEVRSWPADGNLPLPMPFPNITAADLLNGSKRQPLKWVFNSDATRMDLEVPTNLLRLCLRA